MNAKIDTAIETLLAKVNSDVKADEALKFTQATLNLAHLAHIMKQVNAPSDPKAA